MVWLSSFLIISLQVSQKLQLWFIDSYLESRMDIGHRNKPLSVFHIGLEF